MNKKALLMGLWMVLLISFVSAWEFDNVATNWNAVDNSLDIVDGYGLGDTVAHIKLVENTDQALINGRAVFEITLYEDYTEGVVDGTDFVDRSGEAVGMVGSWSYLDNRSYVVPIQDWETICYGNGTCVENLTGTHNETRYNNTWVNYGGEDMVGGNYKFKIEAKKQQMEDVDFIPELFGVELPQWAWWNNNWYKRQKIDISENSGTTSNNYTFDLNITYDSDMQTDFDDLRFVDSTETEELNYWIESYIASNSAQVRVKVPTLTMDTNTSIYMYYDNTLAISTSDPENAFLFYDNASTDRSSEYTEDGGCILTHSSSEYSLGGGSGNCVSYPTSLVSVGNVSVNGTVKDTGTPYASGVVMRTTDEDNTYKVQKVNAEQRLRKTVGGGETELQTLSSGLNNGQYYNYHLTAFDNNISNEVNGYITSKLDTEFSTGNAGIFGYTTGGSSQFELLIIRAYTYPEPTVTFGAESPIGAVATQIEPLNNSVTSSSMNINFSCNATTTDSTGTNITNMSYYLYNPLDNLDLFQLYTFAIDETNSTTTSFLYNLTNEGNWIWSCYAGNTEGFTTYTSNFSLWYDRSPPNLTLYNPILEGDSASARLDFLVQDVFPDKCFYSLDGSANVTLGSCSSNTTFNAGSYGSHSFSFYANDTVGNLNETHRDFLVIEKISETYEASVIETTTQTFDIVLDDTTNLEPAVTLKYDNTDYSGTLVGTSGTQKTYRTIFNIGNVSIGTSETRHFNWTMSGSVDGNAGSYTFPTNSQTVSALIIVPTNDPNAQICDDVSATLHMVNYTFLNEETDDTINGINLTAYYKVWVETESNYVEKSWVETHSSASTYPVCLFPNDASIYADVKLIYGGEGDYAIREFNLQGQIFNNQTQEYNLYMANDTDTSTITITVQESSGIELVDYLVKAIKVNYGNATNLEYEVESHITDGNGQTIFELYPEDYYYFEVWKDGVLKHTESPPAIVTGDFTITVSLQTIFDPNVEAEIEANVISSLSYNNNTGNITTTWSDSMGLINQACLRVWNGTSGSSNPFSNSCDGNLSGTLSQNIGNYTGMIFYSGLFVTSVEDGIEYKIESLDVDLREGWQVFSREGLLWGGVVATTTIALLAVPSPTAVITVGIATFAVLGYVLNIFSIGWGVFVFIAFLGIVFIIYMRD